MRERAPQPPAEITKERLAKVLSARDGKPEAAMLLNMWRNQEVNRRMAAKDMAERFKIHLDTAYTLRDLGLIQDARDMLADIADTAQEFDEPEFVDEARDALKALPSIH